MLKKKKEKIPLIPPFYLNPRPFPIICLSLYAIIHISANKEREKKKKKKKNHGRGDIGSYV